jgi:N-methylhydantoinase B
VAASARTEEQISLDPITFSILSGSLVNLVDEMVSTVQRTCLSFSIYVGDFSGAVMDAEGRLVAEGTRDVAVHVGALEPSTKAVLEDFPRDEMKPGDVFIFNDPHRGGTHLPDMTFIRPVFWDDEVIAFVCSKGHWLDVGGSIPGSMDALAKDIYQEGLQVPPVKIVDGGVVRQDVARFVLRNVRIPLEAGGDMWAQIAGTKTGERRLLELIEKYGIDTVVSAFNEVMDHSERQIVAEVLKCPEGTWEIEDFIDRDPGDPDRGPVRVHVKLSIQHEPPKIVYDLRGSDPPTNSGMNATRNSSFGALQAGTKHVFPHILLNAGWLRVIEAIYPESSVLNAPRPHACCAEMAGAYEKLCGSVIAVWGNLKPDKVWAPSFNNEYFMAGGVDDRPGMDNKYFVYYHWMMGGWGGMSGRDGRSAGTPIFGAGCANQALEQKERQSPITVQYFKHKTDSMGAGRWRGGCGMDSAMRIDNAGGVLLSYVGDRGKYGPGGPRGLFGGGRAMYQGVTYNPGTPKEKWLDVMFSGIPVETGAILAHYTQGGGGYGNALERDPHAVLEDVLDEFVSIDKAREDYGVVIRPIDPEILDYEIDWDATNSTRARLMDQTTERK